MSDHTPACVIPTTSGRACTRSSLPGAPFPICLNHAAEVYTFIEAQRTKFNSRRGGLHRERWLVDYLDPELTPDRAQGVVYYVRVGDRIKIGTTADLPTRMRSYPPGAELLATEPGTYDTETRRLDEFAHLHTDRREWFRPGLDLLDHINALRLRQGSPHLSTT